ncbi:histidine phosphatase family protein [Candidatus Thiosymbion oneisti]|uniref:histidine phosphatase family protein n=1 Tax=Candidatus Thiosymbion oneisti TaxID=589554 RepID=UPI0034E09638
MKQQGMQLDEVISSPVKRCIQTAERIVEGLQSGIRAINESEIIDYLDGYVVEVESIERDMTCA